MFEPDLERTYFELKREQIITLLNSTIRPQVAIAGPTEPADAYVCTFKRDDNTYETLIYFTLVQSNKGIVYHWDEGPQPRDNAKSVEREALRFLDEMGFQMDSLHFRKQSAEEQQRLMDTLPCFHPPAPPGEEEMESLEAVAVEEAEAGEAVDEIEDIAVESLEAEEVEAQTEVAAGREASSAEEKAFEIPEEPATEPEPFEEINLDEELAAEAEPEAGPVMEAEEAPAAATVPAGEEQEISLEEDFEEFEAAAEAVEEAPPPEAEPAPPAAGAAPPPEPPSAPEVPKAPPKKPSPAHPQKKVGVTKTDMEGVDLETLARFLASM